MGRSVRRAAVPMMVQMRKKKPHTPKRRNSTEPLRSLRDSNAVGGLDEIVKSVSDRDGNDPSFAVLEENNVSVVLDRIERIEKIISLKKELVSSPLDDSRDEIETEKKYVALLEKVERRISHARGYCSSISLVFFCGLYLAALLYQIDNESTCGVEGAFITDIIYSLPGGIQGGYLSSTDDFWDFLSSSIIGATFKDPKCGDGTCDLPTEFPGFGRFGCIPDCGRYVQTTTLTVDLRDFINNELQYNANKQPCSVTDPKPPCRYLGGVIQSNRTSPKFTYNIYSNTMGDYLWKNDVDVNQVQRVEVPDGDFVLHLYQARKTSEAVDLVDIYMNLFLIPSSVPRRNTSRDFDYGDAREYLATSAALISDINDFCWGGDQATHNYVCDWHPSLDTMISALGSYGITGSVVMSKGMRRTTTLARVDFCSALPEGNLGLTSPDNRQILKGFGVKCPQNRRREEPHHSARDSLLAPGTRAGSDGRRALRPDSSAASVKEGDVNVRAAALPIGASCAAHSDCDQRVADPFINHTGTFCGVVGGKGPTCSYCAFCQSDYDGVDGRCIAQCGQDGEFPQCIDAGRLVSGFACPSTYGFSVYEYGPEGSPPTVQPPSQPSLPEITPHNYLVGPIMVSQVRRRQGPCSDVLSLPMRVFSNRTTCPVIGRDSAPYGMDPAFLSASAIYDGKLNIANYYNDSEVKTVVTAFSSGSTFTDRVPYGFFPHQYDGGTGLMKDPSLIVPRHRDTFKLYFDGILTLTQANNMITYMQEGGFIDGSTESINIEMITFNVDLNLFSVFTVFFRWEKGGSISWDFKQHSQRFDTYTGERAGTQRALEVICLLLLSVFMAVDAWRIVVFVRKSRFAALVNFGNLFDWAHWALMSYAWSLWYNHCALASRFSMLAQSDYWVLADPTAGARMLLTNATTEMNYLRFHEQVINFVFGSAENYNALISCSVVLFVIRVLRSFEFQIHLGVITRTFGEAWENLLHFMALVLAVFVGYSVAGHLMFGHEVETMSTVEKSMLAHFWITLTLDPTTFYDQLSHAAPAWIFQLYCWSFVLVCGFLLFNIFLAILVDAYVEVRGKALSSKSLLDDAWDVASHAAKALVLPRKVFMSDWDLRARLLRVLNTTQQQKAVLPQREQVLELLMSTIHKGDRALHLPGGVEITARTLSALGRPPQNDPLQSCVTPFSAEAAPPGILGLGAGEAGDVEPWVDRIMDRYADPIDARKLEQAVIADIQTEGLKRDLFTYRAHQRIHDAVVKVDALLELVAGKVLSPAELRAARALEVQGRGGREDCNELLQVTIMEAEQLPKMDLLRSVDPFCLVCMVSDLRDPTGKQTYKTRVVAGDRNPQWHEQFMFPLPPAGAARDGPVVTVVVLDYDKCSVDDLIGCVSVDVATDVPRAPGFLEDWFPIVAGGAKPGRLPGARLRMRLERLGRVHRGSVVGPAAALGRTGSPEPGSGGGGAIEESVRPEAVLGRDDVSEMTPVLSGTQDYQA